MNSRDQDPIRPLPSEVSGVTVLGKACASFWGMPSAERIRRMAHERAMEWKDVDTQDADTQDADAQGPILLSNAAFAYDPLWFDHVRAHPDRVLTCAGVPVLAHCRTSDQRAAVAAAMVAGSPLPDGLNLRSIDAETGLTLYNPVTRNRFAPFVGRLTPQTLPALERASYYGAYKGVTDLLTKYLWPEWALHLTRVAARLGLTPNQVTTIGLMFCVLTAWLFWAGRYWPGMATALVFMVLDTVDGKLARCTITSSRWGDVFDHGIDLIHPPFWWWAWCVGLTHWGLALAPAPFLVIMGVLLCGYVIQRLIEGWFIVRNGGLHIHMWEQVDSRFRLITARRNPNMVILLISLLVGRPDGGIVAVAGWTVISCLFHLARLAQAEWGRARGRPVRSWMEMADDVRAEGGRP